MYFLCFTTLKSAVQDMYIRYKKKYKPNICDECLPIFNAHRTNQGHTHKQCELNASKHRDVV